MEYVIEKNIPIPNRDGKARSVYSFMLRMKPNESVFICPTQEEKERPLWIHSSMSNEYRKRGIVHSYLYRKCEGGVSKYFISAKETNKEGKKGHRWFCIKEVGGY